MDCRLRCLSSVNLAPTLLLPYLHFIVIFTLRNWYSLIRPTGQSLKAMVSGVRHPYDPNPRANPHAFLLRYGGNGAIKVSAAANACGGIGNISFRGSRDRFQQQTLPAPPLGMVGLGGPFGGGIRGMTLLSPSPYDPKESSKTSHELWSFDPQRLISHCLSLITTPTALFCSFTVSL